MKTLIWTTAFKKDYKRMMKRGKPDVPIKEVIRILAEEKCSRRNIRTIH